MQLLGVLRISAPLEIEQETTLQMERRQGAGTRSLAESPRPCPLCPRVRHGTAHTPTLRSHLEHEEASLPAAIFVGLLEQVASLLGRPEQGEERHLGGRKVKAQGILQRRK